MRAGLEGKVWVKIWVDKEGRPKQVVILKSDAEIFNEPAVEAAKQWVFTPAYMNNGPVAVWVSYSVPVQVGPTASNGRPVCSLPGEAGRYPCLPPGFLTGEPMDPMRVVRYVVLALSAGAMAFGVLIMLGVLVPVHVVMPGEYRIIVGLVVLLYGLYRFVVTINPPTQP